MIPTLMWKKIYYIHTSCGLTKIYSTSWSVQSEIKKLNQNLQMLECEMTKILRTVSCLEEKLTTQKYIELLKKM